MHGMGRPYVAAIPCRGEKGVARSRSGTQPCHLVVRSGGWNKQQFNSIQFNSNSRDVVEGSGVARMEILPFFSLFSLLSSLISHRAWFTWGYVGMN